MTSVVLLFWITSGILLQMAIYLGIGFWRHWQGYQALRSGTEELNLSVVQTKSSDSADIPVVAAWPGLRTFKVERKVVEDSTNSVCSFYLKPEDGQPLPHFLPGQFLTFQLDIPNAVGETKQIIRCYSLSDSPSNDHYRISIKRAPSPVNSDFSPGHSSNYFHDQVGVGSRLQVRAPAGHFHIDHSDAPVVLIGGGIGITPMLSILNWALSEQPGREVWLFYGVRNGRELVMKSRLETLAATHPNFHLHFCFSNPLAEEVAGRDFQHGGRIDVALLRTQLPLKPFHYYICGPTPLLESLVPALEDWGVPDAHIHFEAFGPSSVKRRPAATTAAQSVPSTSDIVVTFGQSGKQLPWHPATANLLDFAEAIGISVNSGCRAGSCGSCQTKILAGEVAYTQPPEYDPEPGTCLLCMCKPKTNVTLEV